MANTFGKSQMAVLFEEIAETTAINMTLSKSLDMYNMDEMADMGRTSDGADPTNNIVGSYTQQDQEWIPQEYRFDVLEGIQSSDSDFENLVDRYIPVRRNRALRVLARINVKDLRDPARMKKKAQGMARDMANAIDTACYQAMINEASMVVTSTTDFDYQLANNAELLMLDRGMGGYNKNLFLSSPYYRNVANDLGENQYYGKEGGAALPYDAFTKAQIPNLAGMNTMRSDYRLNLTGNATTGLTVNGDQSHTVATNNADGFFLDNRSMTLNITGATTVNMPAGTKFTIAGVNALNPETRTDNGELMTFTVKSNTVNGSAVVQPAIVSDANSPYRNVSAQAADTAAITILNTTTTTPTLFYTPESTVLIPGRLPVPPEAENVGVMEATTENGLPMRMTYWYDQHNEVLNCKLLCYFDVQVIYPWMLGAILANQS